MLLCVYRSRLSPPNAAWFRIWTDSGSYHIINYYPWHIAESRQSLLTSLCSPSMLDWWWLHYLKHLGAAQCWSSVWYTLSWCTWNSLQGIVRGISYAEQGGMFSDTQAKLIEDQGKDKPTTKAKYVLIWVFYLYAIVSLEEPLWEKILGRKVRVRFMGDSPNRPVCELATSVTLRRR